MKNTDLRVLLNPAKIIPHYINRKSQANSNPPIAVEFHWCTTCNYNCVHCSYAQRRKKYSVLSQEIVEQTVKDLIDMKVKAVYFSGGGEPTTYKNWDKYAQEFLDNNIETALITNSVPIQENQYKLLKKFNYIAVSVYSTDEAEYKQITGSNNFEKQFALPSKLNSKNENVIVGARCVINNINYKNIINTYKKAIEEGFDYIIFIPAVDYENKKIDLSDEIKEFVKNIINQNKDIINPVKTNLLGLGEKGIQHYKHHNGDKFSSYEGCFCAQLRTNAFINYDGNIYLCQPLIGQEEYSIGNLNNNTFREIWNSKRHQEVIDKLNKRFISGTCIDCRSISHNMKIKEYQENNIMPDCPQDSFV